MGFFGEDSGKALAEIDAGFAANDAEVVHHAAHALKGLIGNYAATPVFKATARFDDRARAGDLEGARDLLEPLRADIQQLGKALKEFADELE